MKVAVIGSGPGGYVAAIRCAQLGFEVYLIERYARLGGTCLHVGCIPSKALLDSSEHFHWIAAQANQHGIEVDAVKVNWKSMQARKADVVEQNTKGIEYLMKKNKIQLFHGHASFTNTRELRIQKDNGDEFFLAFDKCIIATGSKPNIPAQFSYNRDRIISSTEALSLKEIPNHMAIIGAGVIGLEIGSVFARLGTQVEVVEYATGILPGMDRDCVRELQKSLQKLGMKFHLGQSVESVIQEKQIVHINMLDRRQGNQQVLRSDYCMVAIGRKPYTEGLNLVAAGIEVDDRGRIITDTLKQTATEGIYAIGDVTSGPMLAHKAEEEAVYVAEIIAGQKPHIHYDLIPGVVYTWPELASVGKTEDQLKQDGTNYKVGKFSFKALGRARASGDLDGMVKILTEAQTDKVLGAHLVGARAADLIMELVVTMEYHASAEDIARICHPHPTYSEAIKEAALDATAHRALHG